MRLAVILSVFVLFMVQSSAAQVSDYQRLAFRNDRPNIYIDVLTLPGSKEGTVELTSIFRIDYPFLAFKKTDQTSPKGVFSSAAAFNIEVFNSPKKDLQRDKQVDIEGLKSAGRANWQDTAYAAEYDQTQSNARFLAGTMQVEVPPGYYTYLLKLMINEEAKGRNSRTRNIRVFPYKDQQNGDVVLVRTVDDLNNPSRLTLVNMGSNVAYGEDFYALIHLPNYNPQALYTLTINKVKPREKEEEKPEFIKEVKNMEIATNRIHQGVMPELSNKAQDISLKLSPHENGYTYALVKIPNQSLPNAVYQLNVTASGDTQPVAQRLFQSYWSDIPTSLLSLDVAIDMLRFIADKETIKRIDDGSDREREQKFRAFWKEKDPTPDTEFNELQAEYYRRIDYAYENFSSDRTLGFNSDQGDVYIRYGAPQDVKRTFPPGGSTTEVWTYPNKKFIFQATTGFGDFRLVSN